MKAIMHDRYGEADGLELRNIDRPVVGDTDVLVRVSAATLHMGDWHLMTGLPYLIRMAGFGLRAPKTRVRGTDFAGTVEAIGKQVTQFKVGDDIFGTCQGAFAEYACASEQDIALKPATLSFAQAAAVLTSAFAALQALRDAAHVTPGQKVLIVGASGGVGTFAVQIAVAFGAEVTGVCSAPKVEMVRSIGAHHMIDYAQEDFALSETRYDVILDLGGNRSLSDLRRPLSEQGTLVLIGGEGGGRWMGGADRWIPALLLSPFTRQKLQPLSTKPNKGDLLLLKGMIEDGKITPVIDKAYPLAQTPDAMRYLRQGQARGKIVIAV